MQTAAAGHDRYMLIAVFQRLARQMAAAGQAVDARARARVRERAGNRCEYRHLHQGLNLRVLFLVDVAESILVTAGNAHPSSSNLPGIAGLRLARNPGVARVRDDSSRRGENPPDGAGSRSAVEPPGRAGRSYENPAPLRPLTTSPEPPITQDPGIDTFPS